MIVVNIETKINVVKPEKQNSILSNCMVCYDDKFIIREKCNFKCDQIWDICRECKWKIYATRGTNCLVCLVEKQNYDNFATNESIKFCLTYCSFFGLIIIMWFVDKM